MTTMITTDGMKIWPAGTRKAAGNSSNAIAARKMGAAKRERRHVRMAVTTYVQPPRESKVVRVESPLQSSESVKVAALKLSLNSLIRVHLKGDHLEVFLRVPHISKCTCEHGLRLPPSSVRFSADLLIRLKKKKNMCPEVRGDERNAEFDTVQRESLMLGPSEQKGLGLRQVVELPLPVLRYRCRHMYLAVHARLW